MVFKNKARTKYVANLLQVARLIGVAGCRKDAGREGIDQTMADIRKSEGAAALKTKAEAAYRQYKSTFSRNKHLRLLTKRPAKKVTIVEAGGPGEEEAAAGETPRIPKPRCIRLRGRSFLLCYNWDFFGRDFPDGTDKSKDSATLWQVWKKWKAAKKKELAVRRSTSTMEESLNSELLGRVHFHWKIDLKEAIDHSTTDALVFHGIRPDVRYTWGDLTVQEGGKAARGAAFAEASNRGHFYRWAPKRGSLFKGTNWPPFAKYRVNGRWLEDLWADDKLGDDEYMSLSLKIKRGHAARKRELEVVRADERSARIDKQIADVNCDLSKLKAPFHTFPEVTAWEDSFLKVDFRWKILALCADSASGKSNFAESIFENPCIITVEDAESLDLKEFSHDRNDGLVLDNVNSWGQLRKWRAVLQARNAKSKGGQSATNVFSYAQYLYGVPVVATLDLDTPDAYLVDPQNPQCSQWLLKNCVILRLQTGEAFFDREKVPETSLPNTYSLFVHTLKRRRAGVPPPDPQPVSTPLRSEGPPLDWAVPDGGEGDDAPMYIEEEEEDPFGLGGGGFDDP
jgi:hypothetical protein